MRLFHLLLGTALASVLFTGCTVSTHSTHPQPERTTLQALSENAGQAKDGFIGILEGTTKLVGGTSALIGDLILQPFGLDGPILSRTLGGALIGAAAGGDATTKGAAIGAGVGMTAGVLQQYVWEHNQPKAQPLYPQQRSANPYQQQGYYSPTYQGAPGHYPYQNQAIYAEPY